MTTLIPDRGIALILPLNSSQAELGIVGGKGANLSRLVRAGFLVPDGFLVTTRVYLDFISSNHLEEHIQTLLSEAVSDSLEELERVSLRIRALITSGDMPINIADELRSAYTRLGEGAVAVRSSATAEDLPGMSFAGQQDTFLNIVGSEALLKAVVDCWSSLWTARAIGYRTRNQVSHADIALAVVVQKMVESQVSGVMFTANPVTGLRQETVIDATFGLGEALVSGMVEPDHYVVDPAAGKIITKTLGTKAVSIHGSMGGGTRVVDQDCSDAQSLPDEQILNLAQLGQQVADLYNFPQDIEWAWSQNQLFLLQTRPITSLFPLPEKMALEPLKVFFSFAAVQGMSDPITPLGRDSLCLIFAKGAGLFDIHVTQSTQTILYTAGERLWSNITPLLRNSIGRRVVHGLLAFIEPTARQAIDLVWDDVRLQPGKPGISWHARRQIAGALFPLACNVMLNLASPQKRRRYIVDHGELVLQRMKDQCESIHGTRWEKLSQRADLLPHLADQYLLRTLTLFISGVASGVASWNFLDMLTASIDTGPNSSGQSPSNQPDLFLQVTRGMPYNPTTEMDLALWEMAKTLRRDAPSYQVFQNNDSAELAKQYKAGILPALIQQVVARFLDKYGGRGFAEIDLGRSRWAEEPSHVFEMLGSFLQIEDENRAPDIVFARGADSARQAIDQLAGAVRKTRLGWFKAGLVRFFAGRARQLMGIRESPKFFAVRMMWLVHREMMKSGQEFVQAGELDAADDLFYLSLDEIKAFAAGELREGRGLIADQKPGFEEKTGFPGEVKDWRSLIASRREAYRRELLRRQIPRLLLSDGRAFYEGMKEIIPAGNTLSGSPVSPGCAQGKVRVVLDPRQAHLLPGEIMVCPGTDPSWTPLFLSAAGLVMETGGMMTHGAVVAREYGIPAIVGVNKATLRLHTGQSIQINGSTGQIVIMDSQTG